MTRDSRDIWLRLFAALMAVALIAAACGSDDDDASGGDGNETNGADDSGGNGDPDVQECIDGLEYSGDEMTAREYEFVHQLCVNFSAEQLAGVMVNSCGDEGPIPEILRGGQHLLWPHGVIRFHPTDTLNDGGPPRFEPTVFFADLLADEERGKDPRVVVIDEGLHLEFISAIIKEMTDIDPVSLDLGPTEDGKTDLSKVSWLRSETEIVNMLDDVTTGDLVNMSFGTYTCTGEGPRLLKERMGELAGAGARFFASAGNDETEQMAYPAGFGTDPFDQVLAEAVTSVGSTSAVDIFGEQTIRSCFSNYGEVEAWVPGEEVGTQVGDWSGTSFAAPQALSLALVGLSPSRFSSNPVPPGISYEIEWIGSDGDRRSGETYCSDVDGYAPWLPGLSYQPS